MKRLTDTWKQQKYDRNKQNIYLDCENGGKSDKTIKQDSKKRFLGRFPVRENLKEKQSIDTVLTFKKNNATKQDKQVLCQLNESSNGRDINPVDCSFPSFDEDFMLAAQTAEEYSNVAVYSKESVSNGTEKNLLGSTVIESNTCSISSLQMLNNKQSENVTVRHSITVPPAKSNQGSNKLSHFKDSSSLNSPLRMSTPAGSTCRPVFAQSTPLTTINNTSCKERCKLRISKLELTNEIKNDREAMLSLDIHAVNNKLLIKDQVSNLPREKLNLQNKKCIEIAKYYEYISTADKSNTSLLVEEISDNNHQLLEKSSLPHEHVSLQANSDRLKLESWGLPNAVLRKYLALGITSMFDWQAECLCTGQVLAGGNLLYSAPTSAGKTLVAELLVLKRVLESHKKAIIILPFVSVCREKALYLQNLFQDAGVVVDGYYGSCSPTGGFNSVDVAVCTIEKANSLINRLLEEKKLNQLGILVVDELHLLGDSHRGYLLELMLTKVRFACAKLRSNRNINQPVCDDGNLQIVGMSATLPNLDLLARWLEADLYHTDYRPVPLMEMVKIGADVYDSEMTKIRSVVPKHQLTSDEDHVVTLCLETVLNNHMVLVFCSTKNWCEKLAETIAREFANLAKQSLASTDGFVRASDISFLKLDHTSIRNVIEQLRSCPVGLDDILARTVPSGVAFHHAGLTFDERDIIEGAFRNGYIKVLIATSTLSSGVNLPARRVIIRTPIFHGSVIDILTYRQMIGRAGRKGLDEHGESLIVCKPSERSKVSELIKSSLSPVHSCLASSGDDNKPPSNSMKRAILEIVVSGVAACPEDVEQYASCTLLAAEQIGSDNSHADKMCIIRSCIDYLLENEFISLHFDKTGAAEETKCQRYVASQLGCAVLASSLSPDEGISVYAELCKARQCFVLENEMHLIYLVTPIYVQDQWVTIDWYQYLCCWERLPCDMKRVALLVGVKEEFLSKAVRGRLPDKTGEQQRLLSVHRRFYASLVLYDLVHEVPLNVIARKYNCQRGALQSLQQAASTFAGMVTVFCNRLGWRNLELLLGQFQSRLNFGVQPELMDLVRISLLNAQRARILYDGGYHTIALLAKANVVDIEALMRKSLPFQMKKRQNGETDWEAEERNKWRCIWLTGERGITEQEAATLVINEAKVLLQKDLSELGIEWKPEQAKGKKLHQKKSPNSSLKSMKLRKRSSPKCTKNVSIHDSHQSFTVLTPPHGFNVSSTSKKTSLMSQEAKIKYNIADESKRENDGKFTRIKRIDDLNANKENKLDITHHNVNNYCGSKPVTDSLRNNCNLNKIDIISDNSTATISHGTVKNNNTDLINTSKIISINACKGIVSEYSKNGKYMDYKETTNEVCDGQSLDIRKRKQNRNVFTPPKFKQKSPNQELNAENQMLPVKNFNNVSVKSAPATASVELIREAAEKCKEACQLSPAGTSAENARYSEPLFQDELAIETRKMSPRILNATPLICNDVAYNDNERVCNLQCDDTDCFADSFVITTQISQQLAMLTPAKERREVALNNSLSVDQVKTIGIIRDYSVSNNPQNSHCHGELEVCEPAVINCEKEDRLVEQSDACQPIDLHNMSDALMPASCYDPCNNKDYELLADNNFRVSGHDMSGSQSLVGSQADLPRILDDDFACCSPMMMDDYDRLQSKNKICHANTATKSRCEPKLALSSPNDKKINELDAFSMTPFSPGELQAVDLLESNNLADHCHHVTSARTISSHQIDMQQNQPSKPGPTIDMKQHVLNDKHHAGVSCVKGSEVHNSSAESDCVPPTPPNERNLSKSFTPLRKLNSKDIVLSPKVDCEKILNEVKNNEALCEVKNNQKLSKVLNGENPITFKSVTIEKPTKSLCIAGEEPTVPVSATGNNGISNATLPSVLDSQNDDSLALNIIDVTSDKLLFETFINEWKTKTSYSISVACEKLSITTPHATMIGGRFKKDEPTAKLVNILEHNNGIVVEPLECLVVGLAVCWEQCDAYYINLSKTENLLFSEDGNEVVSSLAPPPLDSRLTINDRLDGCLSCLQTSNHILSAWDLKAHYKLLTYISRVVLTCQLFDPTLADWLLDPGSHQKTINRMVTSYIPTYSHLLTDIGSGTGTSSISLDVSSSMSSRVRACIEAILVHKLVSYFTPKLNDAHLYRVMIDVEMPTVLLLANMELNGIGFSQNECNSLRELLQAKLAALEEQAYELAGHVFSLTSPDDISKVLYVELRLPPSGDPNVPVPPSKNGAVTRGRSKKIYSTAKDVLEKLKELHPLPRLILEWRRITNALSKVVFPLQNSKVHFHELAMFRIYGSCEFYTATGRVTMTEPNLQNIPKDFDIQLPGIIAESPPSCATNHDSAVRKRKGYRGRGDIARSTAESASGSGCIGRRREQESEQCHPVSISMRHAFIPFEGGVIVAADYSQLELRLIAHLSKDRKLIDILNGGNDVFKMIASQWQGIPIDLVTAEQRQHAKGICYGIVYGITPKGLSEQLNVSEEEAEMFIDSFKNKYSGMRRFLREVVQSCREKGYVETILGRRRYLPSIKDTNIHARAHAERQAVNTTVQGSAADLVKTAMIRIDNEMRKSYPQMPVSHRHRRNNVTNKMSVPVGAYFILQLHDELIYEVNKSHLTSFTELIQRNMETAISLSVKLPVKVKVGPTWGKVS